MKVISCEKCGSKDFTEKDGIRICSYCLTSYIMQLGDIPIKNTNITIDDDVKMLLQKCRNDPGNARRYASLVLDIDPCNTEARKYL